MPVQFDSPAGRAKGVVFDAPAVAGVVFDDESPYSPAGMIKGRQALVQSQAEFRRRREEADAAAALPRVGVGIRAPFGGDEIARFELPEELVAFGSEAIKSSPSTAAGIAAASAATPFASRAGMIPGPIGAAARLGIPVVAGGVAALGTRLAQDELLPQILPEQMQESYRLGTEIAGRNPTSAMLGQFAGAAPFFRPGLPIGTDGSARVAVPMVTGGISGGIEGAQQLAEGDFDAQRLALATAGGALLNRETRLGARLGPNLVMSNIEARAPAELDIVGRTLREPVLPEATGVAPAELDTIRQASAISANETAAARQSGERSVTNMEDRIDTDRVRALAERMMGKSPEDQLSILDQEMRLQKDYLTEAEQRAGLDMKLLLKQQIDQQKALEQAAKAEQDAAKAAEKAQQQAASDAQAAMTPPEPPKSQQILQESATPPPLANIATEVATQTKQSPFALQAGINKMAQVEATAPLPPAAGQIEPVPIGPRDATMSTGDGVPTAKEKKMLAEQKRLVEEYQKEQEKPISVTLYHGGPKPDGPLREPAFLTTEKSGAEWYAAERGGDSPTVSEFSAEIRKPLNIDEADGIKIIVDAAKSAGVPVEITGKIGSQGWDFFSPEISKHSDYDGSSVADLAYVPKVRAALKKLGYDAIKVSDMLSNDFIETFIVLDPKKLKSVEPEVARTSPEQRLNDAGSDLPPISGMSRQAKRAELDAGGIKTYNGKPLDDANPAEISAAVGKLRRGQLERGAASPKVLTPVATSAAGGLTGFVGTEKQPGETDEEYQARRLRNAGIGAALGGGAGVGLGTLAVGAQARRNARAKVSGAVDVPEAGPGKGVRQTAEKIIENRSFTKKLRQTLADDPDILYDKFALGELSDRVSAATIPELQGMLASANIRERLGATAELANRYSLDADPAKQAEGARLYSELAQNLTNPAQLLGLGKLVKTPQGFVTAINAALKNVKRTLSVDQEKTLNKLAADNIKAERELSAAERAAETDFSEANEAAFKAAELKAGTTKKALDDFVHQVSPESWGEITSKIIQVNLMAPLSFVKNIYGNLVYQPVLRGVDSVASALDIIHSTATKTDREIDLLNPLPRARELAAAADGIRIAGREMLTGPSADSYVKAEVQRGFKPLRSLVSAFSGENLAVRPDGSVSMNDRAKKFIEGTLGVAPEISFRLLNLGDKGFRRAAEMRILLEQGRMRGLTGRDLDKFLQFPDKATQELVNTEGRSAIFAQENPLSTKLTPLLDKGIAEFLGLSKYPAAVEANKVLGRLIVPFRNFPVNFVSTAVNFAVPEIGMARAVFEASKGNRREAYRHVGEAAIGFTMLAGGKYLYDKGVISEPADKDAKQRSVQYEQMGPQRLNISGLKRLTEGGNPTYQLGDETRDWGSMGIPAASFYVLTSRAAKGKNAAAKVGEKPQGKYAFDRLSAIPGMASFAFDQSFLSGTSAFLDALKDWDEFGDKFTQNMFRAVTSIAAPNSLEAYAKTQFKYIPELRGDNLTETLKNVWEYKTLQLPQDARSNVKRDLWGEPILRTPEGKNPYIHQFVDVTKAERKQPDPFKQGLIDLYKETGTPDVYPQLPARIFQLQGNTVTLTPDDYNTLQRLTGSARREIAEAVVSDPFFTDKATLPEEKIIALQKAYSAGAKYGKSLLIDQPGFSERYPELFGERVQGEGSRIINRDPAARARLRMAIEEQEDTPSAPR